MARRRRRWKAWQARLDPQRLIFIDETWIKTNMAPLRGWGPKGQRLHGYAPHGHWRTMTFLAALRCDRVCAPCVFDGPINGVSFRAYVEQQLIQTLRPGEIVIMDNLGSHKSQAVREAIKSAGARLWFLPPYSPDLNPIEQASAAHRKEILRKGHDLFETIHIRADGTEIPMEVNTRLIDYDDGKAFLSFARDITARKQSQLIQERFFNAMDKLEAGFVLWNSEENFMFCNNYFKELEGEIAKFLEPGIGFESFMREIAKSGRIKIKPKDEEDWL